VLARDLQVPLSLGEYRLCIRLGLLTRPRALAITDHVAPAFS
jgi:hypothetical protein